MTINKKTLATFLCLMLVPLICSAQVVKQYVNITKHEKLWVEQYGTGSPTVVLINGGGDTINTEWLTVIPKISKVTRVIAYDRAGEIKSPGLSNIKKPREAKGIVHRLRLLLSALKVKPPYILVAHSIGGLYAQYFARNYPNEVAAIVSIDGNLVEQQYPSLIPGISKKWLVKINNLNKKHELKLQRELYSTLETAKGKPTAKQAAQIEYSLEVMGKKASAKQVHDSPKLSNKLRLVVLDAGQIKLENDIQKSFAEQVPMHTFINFPYSGHYIQHYYPNQVNTIIKSTIWQVRGVIK